MRDYSESFVNEITVSNPDDALMEAMEVVSLPYYARERSSRAGPTVELPYLSVTNFYKPEQKIPFMPVRDVNIFFSLFESLWYLYGGDDLASMLYFNSNFGAYSDDGKVIRGSAYGKRWRSWFKHDQLDYVRKEFASNPATRRIVVTMWDAASDPLVDSKDVPCNLMVLFNLRDDKLDMTVYNRSNDIIYGAYSSNVIHFSVFFEYVAHMLGVPMGLYQQVSNCSHGYVENEVFKRVTDWMNDPEIDEGYRSPYETGEAKPRSILHPGEPIWALDGDIKNLIDLHKEGLASETPRGLILLDDVSFKTSFFHSTVLPMMRAWKDWKEKKGAKNAVKHIEAALEAEPQNDWLIAGREWMRRRVKNA